ncbi:MAG TPA: cupin domain-containing protein [Chondromyces sp.]|nr:cupin domain-containing protein [Chondromyces sp.]
MPDTTLKKIDSTASPRGDMGQTYLATGVRLGMRLWQDVEPGREKAARARDYETVGYVIEGRAEIEIEGQTAVLTPGDSWVVPSGASHTYRILEPFTAVEATSPPASVDGRDAAPEPPRRESA